MSDITAVLAMPPPVHGQSLVNERMVGELSKQFEGRLRVFDISPGMSSRRRIGYHKTRISKTFHALLNILVSQSGGVLYTVAESGLGIIYNILICCAARIKSRSIVMHHHTAAHTKERRLAFFALNGILGKKSIHITLSKKMSEDLFNIYGVRRSNLLELSNFPMVDKRICELIINECDGTEAGEQFCIGHLSNLSYEKGLNSVFQVFRNLREKNDKRVRLFLAGPPADKSAIKLIDSAILEFGSDLTYLGRVDSNRKRYFLSQIDLFLFPSNYRFEAQPLSVIEALAAGVPVLAYSAGYTAETLPNKSFVCIDEQDMLVKADSLLQLRSSAVPWFNERASVRGYFLSRESESFLELQLILKKFDGLLVETP